MSHELPARHGRWRELILGALLATLSAVTLSIRLSVNGLVATGPSTPTPDRLAEPPLSENATQYEEGRYLYWLNCMPCHGDQGQGLTDEFRSLWVDDHQNCWDHGCHAGGPKDEGFPLPRSIPAIISPSGGLLHYATGDALFEYLRTTHPPQHPGYLPEDEYWAITAYVLAESNHLSLGEEIGPRAIAGSTGAIRGLAAAGLVLLIVSAVLVWSHKRQSG